MKNCCEDKKGDIAILQGKQRRVLWIILVINIFMFFVESGYGILSRSTSLLADSLDMLGDAFVYGFNLYVIGKSVRWNAAVSLGKGVIMSLFGFFVLIDACYKLFQPVIPNAEIMGTVGFAALTANIICAMLLLRHRSDDFNMTSVWLCSRNDVIANLGVIGAAWAVTATGSNLPDIIVGGIISIMILNSARWVVQTAVKDLKGEKGVI